MNAPPDPVVEQTGFSDRRSGPFGFAGTIPKPATARGLAELPGGELDISPRAPMLPSAWDTGDDPMTGSGRGDV